MESLEEINSAIARLPEHERLVFRMVHVEGYQERETATCLGITRHKFHQRMERAKSLLRNQLAPHFFG